MSQLQACCWRQTGRVFCGKGDVIGRKWRVAWEGKLFWGEIIMCLRMLDGLLMHFDTAFRCSYTLLIIVVWIYCCKSLNVAWLLNHWMLVFLFVCNSSWHPSTLLETYTLTMKNPKPNTNTWVLISPSSTITYLMDTDVANFQPASYWYHTGTKKWN